jgi:hypothetical protein
MTGDIEVTEGQKHGLVLFDAGDLPRELLEPRLPAAPMRWRASRRSRSSWSDWSPWVPPYSVGSIRNDGATRPDGGD